MPPIKVNFAALDNAQADIVTSAARIKNQLDDLKGYVARLAASWDGDAAAAYQQKQLHWDRAAADIQEVLKAVGVGLGEVNANYQTNERTLARNWGG